MAPARYADKALACDLIVITSPYDPRFFYEEQFGLRRDINGRCTDNDIDPLIEENASRAGYVAGDEATMEDLMYAAILPSGADGTLGLANAIAGSEKEFVKMQTERTAKRYNLDEKQAAKLLELNQKYADLRNNYETDLQKIMTPEQFEQYKADRHKHGMRGHHGKGGHHHRDGHRPQKDSKE